MTDLIGPVVKYVIRLPFPGFYASSLSSELDHVEEQEVQNLVERQEEDGVPPELRLTEEEMTSLVMQFATYSTAHEAIAEDYVDVFGQVAEERLCFDLGLHFEGMTSPKEYNFSTDRLFAWISEDSIRTLMVRSAVEGHVTLRKLIIDTFTSRSGFSSSYSNQLDAWLRTPLLDWDHNQLCTLLEAVLSIGREDGGEIDGDVFYAMLDGGEIFYTALSNCIDWDGFDARVEELREEKVDAIREEEDPDYRPIYRCPATADLFERIAA